MTSLTKNTKPKTKNFFSLQTWRLAESFESLNSSLAQLVKGLRSYQDTCKLLDLGWNRLAAKVLTLWRLAAFRDLKKKRLNTRGFVREFLRSGMLYRPGESLKRCSKSSSLHSEKIFLLGGCGFFVSDIISGGLLGHLGPLCLALGTNR